MSEQVNLQEALVKKAAFGNDIDLEKFDDNNEQHVQSTAELSAAGKERLEHVGIDLERENRSASFIQVDNAPIEAEVKPQLPLELMNTGVQYLREHMSDKARIHYAITPPLKNILNLSKNTGGMP